MDPAHERTDQALDDPAEVGLPDRPILDPDAVLLAPPRQGFALELGGVVHVDRFRLAPDRPLPSTSRRCR